MFKYFTLSVRRNNMQNIPRAKSPASFVSDACMISSKMLSIKPHDLNLTPSMPFNWDTITIIDVAVVKPDVTGVEMKFTRKPKNNLL